MKYLQLEKHLIPAMLIKRVEQVEEEGTEEDGSEVLYVHTVIHFKDDTEMTVEEDFDTVCGLLNN